MVTRGKVVEVVFSGNEKSLPFLCSVIFWGKSWFPKNYYEEDWGGRRGSGEVGGECWYWVGPRPGWLSLHFVSSSL